MERIKAILVLTAAIAFAVSPLVSPNFGGYRPDQFPVPQTDPPIQPPGWAFSIWGVIYLWLIVSAGYGLLRRADDAGWDRPRWPLVLSLCIGTAWLPVATTSPIWATVLIWAMLILAVAALLRCPAADTLWLSAPVGLYAGWLTAAACVSTAITLTGYGAAPETLYHLGLLCLSLTIAIGVLLRRTEPLYAAGICWALIGVIAANLSPPNIAMAGTAAVGLPILTYLAIGRRRA
ncbi:hypothetical protein [Pseudooceanicola sp.]|uniref:hypothetical protein n=1 Tax=Pseudooceanicola sp. TaxID=1914328 RepID=UPI00405A4213